MPAAATCKQQGRVDWYTDYASLRPLLQAALQCTDSLLLLGPGTSPLHEQLYDSGYRGITVVDADADVLAAARQRSAAAGRSSLKFQLADIVHGLAFEHTPFNAVIDKGTLDCVLAGPGGEVDARAVLAHVHANLKSSGTLILITHGPPALRMPLLRSCVWESVQAKVLLPAPLQTLADARAGAALELLRDMPAVDEAAAAANDDERASYVYVCRKAYA